jgi:four helix bundle protein
MSRSYKELTIHKDAKLLFADIHRLTMKLPRHELFEIGSQLRRSAGSVGSNIAEGFGRRRYKAEYVRFLIFAHASNLETGDHLDDIIKIYPEFASEANALRSRSDELSRRIYHYIQYVEEKEVN